MRSISVLIVVALSLPQIGCGGQPPPAPATNYSPATEVQTPTREATVGERELYAEREKQATQLETFKGGNPGAVTVLVVVLLVILILILLKVI
jgi:hypothetical protein